MAKIDVKFSKGNKETVKAMSTVYKERTQKPRQTNTGKKK